MSIRRFLMLPLVLAITACSSTPSNDGAAVAMRSYYVAHEFRPGAPRPAKPTHVQAVSLGRCAEVSDAKAATYDCSVRYEKAGSVVVENWRFLKRPDGHLMAIPAG